MADWEILVANDPGALCTGSIAIPPFRALRATSGKSGWDEEHRLGRE